jgi:LacI family transcriptional regulator, galactose operon repressor
MRSAEWWLPVANKRPTLKRVTRDDVAKRAKTSTAVVSYVVNGGPRSVSKLTQDRVNAAIEELGYRPNGLARALRANRTLVLGLLVPDATNPFFAQLAKAVEDVAFSQGFTLLFGNASDDPERESFYLKSFSEQQIDGLLLVSVGGGAMSSGELDRLHCRLVVVDRLLENLETTTLVVDNEEGGFLGTRHLIEHGHRVIGCVSGPSDLTPSADRHRGWSRALLEAGLNPLPSLIVRSDMHQQGGYEATRSLLQSDNPPSAIFVSTDLQAIGSLRAIADAGLSVPGDVAIVSFDGIVESAYTVPRLTTIAQPIEEMGRRAMAKLIELVRNPDAVTTNEVLPVQLITRGSCGCRDDFVAEPD